MAKTAIGLNRDKTEQGTDIKCCTQQRKLDKKLLSLHLPMYNDELFCMGIVKLCMGN
jgi:hypothetical protein